MKKIYSVLVCAIILLLALSNPFLVYAESSSNDESYNESLYQKITNFWITTSGAVQKTGDSIMGLPKNIKDSLMDYVGDAILGSNGIYVDEEGNYIFSNQVQEDMYKILSQSKFENVRVVTDFSGFENYFNSGYVNTEYRECFDLAVGDARRAFGNNYIITSAQCRNNKDNKVYTGFYVYGFEESNPLAYITSGWKDTVNGKEYYYLKFYDKNGNTLRSAQLYKALGRGSHCCCIYDSNQNTFTVKKNNACNKEDLPCQRDIWEWSNGCGLPLDFWKYFPNFSGDNVYTADYLTYSGYSIFSGGALVVTDNGLTAQSYLANQNEGILYNYTPSITIPKTTIENNNWENIYNSYVENVNVEYSENPEMDIKEIYNIIKKYTDVVKNAIESGNEDIEKSIDTSNVWLEKIYKTSKSIAEIEGSNSTTVKDMNTTLNGVYSTLQDSANDLDYLSRIYTTLSLIESKIGTGGGGSTIDIPLDEILDEESLKELVSFDNVVMEVLKNIVPFAYIGIFTGILVGLSAEPTRPDWKIPFKVESLGFEEEINLGEMFSHLDTIRPVWVAFFNLIFIVALGFYTFKYVHFILDFFS